MKKFLSLVLALVMTMSLVTISAGAKDFTDSDEITYTEAVDVMSAVGIIDGYDGGSFQPTGTLTRGAASKIIACMMLGKTTAEALGNSAAPFKDVPVGSAFAGYIAYCVEAGIVDGYSDGTFRPSAKLTGFAFLKMLLTALGYDSDIEGFTGTNWTVNVSSRAIEIGLTDGNDDFVGTELATREEACLYAVNTLKATLVKYESKGSSIVINGVEVVEKASDPVYVTSNVYSAATSIDDTKDNATGDYTVEFAEKYQPKLKLISTEDDFDRPAYTWNWDGKDIGTYVDWAKMVGEYTVAVTGEDLYNLLSKSIIDKYTVEYYLDGKADTTIKNSNMIRTNDTSYATTGKGVLTQVFVDNDDELVTITSINTYLAEVTSDYNEKRGTLAIDIYQADGYDVNETLSIDDLAIEDYKEGDMLRVCVAETSANKYSVITIAEPEVMSNSKVTKFSERSYLVTGGEQYDYAKKGTVKNDLSTYYGDLLDNTYNIYMDDYGYVLGTVKVDGDLKYLFLTGYDKSASHLAVKTSTGAAIFLDGTFEEIQINVSDTNTNIATYQAAKSGTYYKQLNLGDNQYNKWFTYTVTDSGVYTLTPVNNWMDIKAPADPANLGEVTKINPASVRLNSSSATLGVGEGISKYAYGNDDSVYFTVDIGDVSDNQGGSANTTGITKVTGTYTGVQSVDLVLDKDSANGLSNMNNTTNDTNSSPAIFAVYDKDLYIIGAVVVGEDENNTKNYAYALKSAQNEYVDDAGNYYWDFEAVVDGQIKTLTVKEKGTRVLRDRISTWIGLSTYSLIQVTYDADGYVVDAVQCVDNAINATQTDDKVYSNTEFVASADRDDYKVYDVMLNGGAHESLMAVGNTLYVENYTVQDIGLTIASGAPVVLVQQDTAGRWVINEYTTIKQALDQLEDADTTRTGVQFKGHIAAVLNSNTTAQYLVIKSETLVPVVDDDGTNPIGNLASVNIAWDGYINNNMWLNLLDKNGNKLTSGTYTYTLYVRSNNQSGFDIAETGTVNAAAVNGAAFKTGLATGSSWYIEIGGLTSNVITQGV